MEIAITENSKKVAKGTNNAYNPEQVAIIKNTVAKGASTLELAYFLNVAASLNLNPFNKEVWCYKDNKGNLIVFAGRDGFLKAAQSNPIFNGIRSCEVRKNDTFKLDIPNAKVVHEITHMSNKERGPITGAYAIAFRKNGEPTIEWADFETYNRGYNVWKTHPSEMIKKVAETKSLKKGFGISGLQSEYDFDVTSTEVAVPINSDPVKMGAIEKIERLLSTSSLSQKRREAMDQEIPTLEFQYQADEMIKHLQENQLDPVHAGMNYNQTDIQNNLNNLK